MKIATWNINGVKARISALLTWLEQARPDVVALQEIKSVDEGFPRLEIEALGYNVETHGQKGFNGVAILSKFPLSDVTRGLPGDDDDTQSRYIQAMVEGETGVICLAAIYLPNGNPVATEKYAYKLAWMDRLIRHAGDQLRQELPFVIAGDYNVIPQPGDVHDPAAWADDALFQPVVRNTYRRLLALGMTDAVRATSDADGLYTFWDYQAGAWQKNNGIRIDHVVLSPQAADRLQACGIDTFTRSWEKPSDHVPVWVELAR